MILDSVLDLFQWTRVATIVGAAFVVVITEVAVTILRQRAS